MKDAVSEALSKITIAPKKPVKLVDNVNMPANELELPYGFKVTGESSVFTNIYYQWAMEDIQ